jgi:hypothetical protein
MTAKMRASSWLPGAAFAGALLASGPVSAFVITAQLTGDGRLDNPDGLVVDVTITSGEGAYAANQAFWLVDLNAASHPDMKLQEFYFNLGASGDTKFQLSNVTFSGFSPAGWSVTSPASVVGGGTFTPNFLFEANGPNPSNVTNAQSLGFLMTLTTGSFTQGDFLNAYVSSSSDTALGSGQLGAHLQSLDRTVGCPAGVSCSDSGFALGRYQSDDDGLPPQSVPEPGTLALLGVGLLAAAGGLWRRRRG